MKFRLLPFVLATALIILTACSDDDNGTPNTPSTKIAITNLSPISGPIGATVTIKGSNFGTDASELTITCGGVPVTPFLVTNTEIKIKVPASLPMGATSIKVRRGTGSDVTVQFTVEDPIVGVWTSQDTDVAPLLSGAPLFLRKLVATFKADGSFLLVQTDSSQASTTFTGTYLAAAGGAPAPNDRIRLITITQQSDPSPVIVEGIYEVNVGDSTVTMQFEVVSPAPPLSGKTKPTPEGGFGSTAGGQIGTINVQTYIRK